MRHLYLLGYPVVHSLSPAMQNAAIHVLGLDYEYSLMPVPPAELPRRIAELRDATVAGFNVTIPHKITVVSLLDVLDATASAVGAVNSVVNDGGCLVGYNTDCAASEMALRERYGSLEGCRVVILGAGGAARAVAYGLSPHAKWIKILARDSEKAESLAAKINNAKTTGGPLSEAAEQIAAADILINATPVGMSPNTAVSPIPAASLHSGLLVFDLIYNPEKTRLLADAEVVGADTLGGLSMLVYQGAEALRLWTGRTAPEALMMEAARRAMRGSD